MSWTESPSRAVVWGGLATLGAVAMPSKIVSLASGVARPWRGISMAASRVGFNVAPAQVALDYMGGPSCFADEGFGR